MERENIEWLSSLNLPELLRKIFPGKWFKCAVPLIVYLTFVGSQDGINIGTVQKWLPSIALYVVYLLLIKGSSTACDIAYSLYNQKHVDYKIIANENKIYLTMFTISLCITIYSGVSILSLHFIPLYVAYLISQYPEMSTEVSPMINYGVGMACSFFEGYLVHVIPSDGHRFVGFQENIQVFESNQSVTFPVKRLFIVITKSLYCPPDLSHFNKLNRDDLPYMEAIQNKHWEEMTALEKIKKSMEDVIKDVAGVKNRTYRNSAYKINRPRPARPVYVSAEFATPLHTLHKVLEKRAIYEKLCDVDVSRIVADFCSQLRLTVERSPDCRGKCELVYFDDTNPDENLADVLLKKIAEIEPKFEEVIVKAASQ